MQYHISSIMDHSALVLDMVRNSLMTMLKSIFSGHFSMFMKTYTFFLSKSAFSIMASTALCSSCDQVRGTKYLKQMSGLYRKMLTTSSKNYLFEWHTSSQCPGCFRRLKMPATYDLFMPVVLMKRRSSVISKQLPNLIRYLARWWQLANTKFTASLFAGCQSKNQIETKIGYLMNSSRIAKHSFGFVEFRCRHNDKPYCLFFYKRSSKTDYRYRLSFSSQLSHEHKCIHLLIMFTTSMILFISTEIWNSTSNVLFLLFFLVSCSLAKIQQMSSIFKTGRSRKVSASIFYKPNSKMPFYCFSTNISEKPTSLNLLIKCPLFLRLTLAFLIAQELTNPQTCQNWRSFQNLILYCLELDLGLD